MPACPKCATSHPDGTVFCPDCGAGLSAGREDLGLAATGFGLEATAYGPAAVRDTSKDAAKADDAGEEREGGAPRRTDEGDALVGQVVNGVYEVLERIGVGGMGVVYKVRHVNLGKLYALKVLGQIAADHPDAVERFKQEAKSASRIEHDNIVDIVTLEALDSSAGAEKSFFIVMELLKGQSLAEALGGGPLAIERTLSIAYQICSALHAAHEAGIIHRDLKPENVFLVPKGEVEFVKILDFGISKIHDAETQRVRITKTGHVLGTPLYMSPEQAKGVSQLDRRVDVYSLGVILYEMLSGRPPFTGDNYFQLIWKHSNEAPAELELTIPAALRAVVMKALEKDPQNRHGSMLELEQALAEAVPEVQPPSFIIEHRPSVTGRLSAVRARPSEPEWRPRRTGALVGAAVTLTAVVALGVGLGIRGAGVGESRAGLVPHDPTSDSGSRDQASGDGASEPAADAGPPGPDRAEAGPAPAMIRVAIRTDPSGAEVFLGAEPLGPTPVEIERRASSAELELRIVKHGYVQVSRSVTLTEDVVVEVALRRSPGKTSPGENGPLPFKTDF